MLQSQLLPLYHHCFWYVSCWCIHLPVHPPPYTQPAHCTNLNTSPTTATTNSTETPFFSHYAAVSIYPHFHRCLHPNIATYIYTATVMLMLPLLPWYASTIAASALSAPLMINPPPCHHKHINLHFHTFASIIIVSTPFCHNYLHRFRYTVTISTIPVHYMLSPHTTSSAPIFYTTILLSSMSPYNLWYIYHNTTPLLFCNLHLHP